MCPSEWNADQPPLGPTMNRPNTWWHPVITMLLPIDDPCPLTLAFPGWCQAVSTRPCYPCPHIPWVSPIPHQGPPDIAAVAGPPSDGPHTRPGYAPAAPAPATGHPVPAPEPASSAAEKGKKQRLTHSTAGFWAMHGPYS